MEAAFEARASMCVLRVVLALGDESTEQEIEISRHDTVAQLRQVLAPLADLPAEGFVIASLGTGTELQDSEATLNDADLDLSDGVTVRRGAAPFFLGGHLHRVARGGRPAEPQTFCSL